ncbi:uncharacterized protein LY89DRAFT_685078 [Mollisia scopiformis]|uniref:Zn(2)-C6 fungal-type domain-containing protein n=1 Tax=Mollisia scopiformis TaxID=149040 RepID=A0A194XAD2_MOLSC|nr:uncharacterized protein LY89DRAFT_685078 [Mollisia scopiformis]KUJ17130.1 hypothetical protein LY89DRAFT_685078 [Mollisia scopiformis]
MVDEERPTTPRKPRNRQSRGKGLRKTTGCITCRRRHVKCGEEQPYCHRCLKANQTCIYCDPHKPHVSARQESRLATTPTAELPRLPSIPQWHNSPEHIVRYPPPPPVTSDNTSVTSIPGPPYIPTPRNRQNFSGTSQSNEYSLNGPTNMTPEATNQQVMSPEMSTYAATAFSLGSNDSLVPRSASSQPTFNVAITRWFDMLVGDSAFESAVPDIDGIVEGRSSVDTPREPERATIPFIASLRGTPEGSGAAAASPISTSPQLLERSAPGFDSNALAEKLRWQSSIIELLPYEHFIFSNFVQRISPMMDLFDPTQNFSAFVPHLAMRNAGLMKAILALSARHISLVPSVAAEQSHDRNDALQYYNETLHYLSKAMQYDTFKTSLELLATVLIISTHEMLDGSGKDWERHLQGVFWIQRSQVIHGDSKGLRAAVWWAWLCQDVWAAFREKRKTFTFWKPTRNFTEMSPHEMAARSVYIIAKVVNYCSKEETEAGDIAARIERANQLQAMLEEWERYLTVEFTPLPYRGDVSSTAFQPIWIHPPAFAVAVQLHYSARLLLLLNKPSRGGFGGYLEQSRMISKYVNNICGIALTLTDHASSVMSSQCLYIAGMCVQDTRQRETVLSMLESCRQRTGWPLRSLGEELQAFWESSEGFPNG